MARTPATTIRIPRDITEFLTKKKNKLGLAKNVHQGSMAFYAKGLLRLFIQAEAYIEWEKIIIDEATFVDTVAKNIAEYHQQLEKVRKRRKG